ncbi:hypothetical protein CD798_12270 [Bacillaceae bacterium SAOS 7]|nr:hypothetical protein CD798_12270 [Bacillaceae bacterium SAOS 7]
MRNWSQSLLDSLLDATAILDHEGYIIANNASWVDHCLANGGDLAIIGVGANYLHVCPKEVTHGVRQVMKGEQSAFVFEYPCHLGHEMKWFLLRVTPFMLSGEQESGVVVSYVDMTESKLSELKLRKSEQRYRMITDHSTDFISVHSLDGVYTYVSPICYHMLGYQPEEMIGKIAYDFFHPDDIGQIASSHSLIQSKNEIQTFSYRIRRKNGEYIWFETKAQKLLSIDDGVEEIICISRDVTMHQLKLKELEIEKQILTNKIYIDELTGLFNRRFFNKKFSEEYEKLRTCNAPLSLLMIDIDYFKQYNDTYGHQQGDEALKAVANRLRRNVRKFDSVCRVGGEEFCVLLPHTSKEEAFLLAERLCQKVKDLQLSHPTSRVSKYVTVSIGASTMEDMHESISGHQSLLDKADQALYEAKRSGRSRVVHQ